MNNLTRLLMHAAVMAFVIAAEIGTLLPFINATDTITGLVCIIGAAGFIFFIYSMMGSTPPLTVTDVYCFGVLAITGIAAILFVWQYFISIGSDWTPPIPARLITTGIILFVAGLTWFALAGQVAEQVRRAKGGKSK